MENGDKEETHSYHHDGKVLEGKTSLSDTCKENHFSIKYENSYIMTISSLKMSRCGNLDLRYFLCYDHFEVCVAHF